MSTVIDDNIEGENNEHSEEATSVDDKIKKSKKFEWFYERHFDQYFEYIKAKNLGSVSVRCLLCPGHKTLSVTTNSEFNLNIHIQVILNTMQTAINFYKRNFNTNSSLTSDNT